MVAGIKVGQRTASVPKQGGVESLSTTEKASGQRLLSTEKRIDAKQFHLARDFAQKRSLKHGPHRGGLRLRERGRREAGRGVIRVHGC